MLSVLLRTSELHWGDGVRTLSQDEALLHLLALAEKSSHRLGEPTRRDSKDFSGVPVLFSFYF